MGEQKRFYWLKLKEDFFRQKEIKKLRKIAGGDVYTIIYLKMLLRAMKDGGKLFYEGIEENFACELALDIDEDADNVKMTVAFLMSNGILVQNQPDEYEILTVDEMTGSECDSAHRVRKLRAQKSLTEGQKALQSNGDVTDSNASVTTSNVEIDKETRVRKKSKSISADARRFTPPELSEVEAYAKEKGYTSQEFSPSYFVDFYQSKGWKVGRDPMKDWKASVRMWVSRYRQEHPRAAEPERPKTWKDLPYDELMRLQDEQSRKDREELRRQGLL